MFDIVPVTGSFGAEIRGVDLACPMTPELAEKLFQTMLDHKVLVFRGQLDLGPAEHLAFARHFGAPVVHPYYPGVPGHPEVTVLESTGTGRFGHVPDETDLSAPTIKESWHTDGWHRENPTVLSMLRAVTVPPAGRDTLFADMEAAFEGLSTMTQRYLEPLRALNDWGKIDPTFEPVTRPVVVTNPHTGRKALYVNRSHTRSIVGMGFDESQAILELLFARARFPEYQIRVHWEPGTMVMWDNQNTQHYLVQDLEYPRTMHRVYVEPDA